MKYRFYFGFKGDRVKVELKPVGVISVELALGDGRRLPSPNCKLSVTSNGCKYLCDLARHALGASNRSTLQYRAAQGRPLRTASHLSLSIIVNVQGKLELITGIPASNQVLSLLNSQEDTTVIAELSDDSKPLEFYGVRDWQVIKVKIKTPFYIC